MDNERRKRGVDAEWAQRVEGRLANVESMLRRLCGAMGVADPTDPTAAEPPRPEEWHPPEREWVQPETAYDAITEARAAIERGRVKQ